jgi:hypothetical protein
MKPRLCLFHFTLSCIVSKQGYQLEKKEISKDMEPERAVDRVIKNRVLY